ncbi:DUF5343 domain-containing protein [Akkermansiaceae bacterium]|nr:DUF5343 domain-containing protein [Akkermansiaceae bacterium]MDA7935096.1 DUF5343 domain-containing protein [Akkermansiaceae bacterium]MDB4411179.1 DUF5343 domain-containing protein [bacterium]
MKNLEGMLNAIQGAQAPEKFTVKFLEGLGFKGNADRLIVGMFKALAFLDDGGRPTKRYFEFLDQSQGARVLADGLRDAYADLFRVNVKAHSMSNVDVINKLKTLSEGKVSDSVAKKMAMTFLGLAKSANFIKTTATAPQAESEASNAEYDAPTPQHPPSTSQSLPALGGLVYKIQIVLPDSRDPAVYDAIFKSLKSHLK